MISSQTTSTYPNYFSVSIINHNCFVIIFSVQHFLGSYETWGFIFLRLWPFLNFYLSNSDPENFYHPQKIFLLFLIWDKISFLETTPKLFRQKQFHFVNHLCPIRCSSQLLNFWGLSFLRTSLLFRWIVCKVTNFSTLPS